jgi:hypothetical protein
VSHLIIMSTSVANPSFVSASSTFTVGGSAQAPTLSISHMSPNNSGTITVNVQDTNGNSMAAGTTVAFTLDNSAIGSVTQSPSPFTVGCNSALGGQNLGASFSATAAGNGNITVQITSPSGSITLFRIPISVT